MTEGQLYDKFHCWLDTNCTPFFTPGIGKIKSRTYLMSDILCECSYKTKEGKYLVDALFEEWLEDQYGTQFSEEWKKK